MTLYLKKFSKLFLIAFFAVSVSAEYKLGKRLSLS